MDWSDWQTASEIFESLATGSAIILGGFWAYNKFIKKREAYPRALLRHQVENRLLNDGKRLIHLAVEIENVGDVLISLFSYDVRIYQILPPNSELVLFLAGKDASIRDGDAELPWPLLFDLKGELKEGDYEIEPREKHVFHYDFVLDENIRTIQLYSYIRNRAKPERDIGWESEQLYDIN